jgi:hypothetical protein
LPLKICFLLLELRLYPLQSNTLSLPEAAQGVAAAQGLEVVVLVGIEPPQVTQ